VSLTTEIWVSAHLRRCAIDGLGATMVKKGDPDAGAVLVKLYLGRIEGCRVMTRVTGPDGEPAWMPALGGGLVPEPEADAYIARQTGRDPDLWVIEVDDPKGRHPFDGKML
jgi:hypothetical protein